MVHLDESDSDSADSPGSLKDFVVDDDIPLDTSDCCQTCGIDSSMYPDGLCHCDKGNGF